MRIKHPDQRKTVLSIEKSIPKAVKELLQIRGDTYSLQEDFDAFKEHNKTIKLMRKKKAAFFISTTNNSHLSIGRAYDGEFLEMIRFKIHKILSSDDFSTIPAEIFVKYFVLFQNITSKRLENLFLDLFHQKSRQINLDAIKYAWIFSRIDNIYTLKYVRVLNDLSIEEVGPYFELEIENEFYCSEELLNKATIVEQKKKVKNVEKNIFKDTVGKLYVDKQDLRDIQLKKNRGYKNKEVNEDIKKKKSISKNIEAK